MTLTQIPLHPVLKTEVILDCSAPTLSLHYKDRGCSFTLEETQYDEAAQFLKLLQIGGQSVETLQVECPGIADEIPMLLKACHQRQLITETPEERRPLGLTGSDFYPVLQRYLAHVQSYLPTSQFGQRMQDHSISRNELVGYVLESYHITYLCPQLLAPALAQATNPILRDLIQAFFVSELHHDQLIARSLNSIGIQTTQLQTMQPLPMTLSTCALLSMFAHEQPLSFMAALMLFEQGNPGFHLHFEQECKRLALPEKFYRPVLVHAGINEEGHHHDVAEPMFATVPWISLSEQEQIKRNMMLLIETFILRTQEIVEYYDSPTAMIPRCFSL